MPSLSRKFRYISTAVTIAILLFKRVCIYKRHLYKTAEYRASDFSNTPHEKRLSVVPSTYNYKQNQRHIQQHYLFFSGVSLSSSVLNKYRKESIDVGEPQKQRPQNAYSLYNESVDI